MKKLSIVVFTTGEYEDYYETPVVAYARRQSARAHARKANDWLRDNGFSSGSFGAVFDNNPYDPGARRCVDYTGAHYEVLEDSIPLLSRVPK